MALVNKSGFHEKSVGNEREGLTELAGVILMEEEHLRGSCETVGGSTWVEIKSKS